MSWLVDTLLATGALIALVLVLRRPVARLFGAGLAYALWALPLLRLVLPPLVLPAQPGPQLAAAPALTDLPVTVLAEGAPAGPDWTALLLGAWLAGVLVFALWRLWGYAAMRRLLLGGAVPVGQVGDVRLVESPATQAPVAFGVRDKVVALPIGFMDRPDRLGRDLAIAHELEHHAARDLAVNLAMQPLLALHWFNPLAWLGWRALRRDQEAACDARVMAGATPQLRAAYGQLIATFAQSPRLALAAPMACPVLGEASVIHRLRSLTMSDQSPRRRQAGRALIASAVLALPLTATLSYAADDLPLPPAAPTPPAAPLAQAAGKQHRIVIVERQGGAWTDESRLKTRVIERGGKTVVFKTDKALTDAEIEQKIDLALRTLPEPPAPPQPPEAPEPPAAPDGPGKVRRIAIYDGAGGSKTIELPDAAQISAQVNAEVRRGLAEARRGMAEARAGRAEALTAIRSARDEVAGDDSLPADIRKRVVQQLDREIERLSRQGQS